MTVFLTLGEGVECNTIFSWPLLKAIKASIITKNNAPVSGIMIENFNMEMMVTQISKKIPKTSERLPVSLLVAISETKNNT